MNWNNHIKKFEKYEDQYDDFDFGSDISPKKYSNYDDSDDSDDDEVKAAFEHLASTIRQMIRNAGIKDFTVTVQNKDFVMEFILTQSQKFSFFMKLIGLMKKIHKDILIQYEPAIDLWYTKDKKPLLTVDFYYKDGKNKKIKWSDEMFY